MRCNVCGGITTGIVFSNGYRCACSSDVKWTYDELQKAFWAARRELTCTEMMLANLNTAFEKVARLQPPAPIVLEVTPDQAERVKSMLKKEQGHG